MPQIIEDNTYDDMTAELRHSDQQRARLKVCLPDIANEVTTALNDAGLSLPVFFTVPSAGPLMTFATPADPDDALWNRVTDIANRIVSRAAGVDHLICQDVTCAAAIPMAAADLSAASEADSVDW